MKFAFLVLLFVGSAQAKSRYFDNLRVLYASSKGVAERKCQNCHGQADLKLNPYGVDFSKAKFRTQNPSDAMKAIETLDSDKDGVSNIEEFLAGTNPAAPEKSEDQITWWGYSAGDKVVRMNEKVSKATDVPADYLEYLNRETARYQETVESLGGIYKYEFEFLNGFDTEVAIRLGDDLTGSPLTEALRTFQIMVPATGVVKLTFLQVGAPKEMSAKVSIGFPGNAPDGRWGASSITGQFLNPQNPLFGPRVLEQ